MPRLEWIGKDKIVNHHRDVPYCVLNRTYSYDSTGQHDEDNGSGNMVVHGDNLYVLKSLLPKYEGKIDLIYIDPPYNTGEEKWVYNDNVNDPQITKWLGEVVGKEGEDLTRHDKWLCMMYPRLRMLKRMLSPRGSIFISIDDNEFSNLKAICDEIFDSSRYIATIVWQKRYSRENREIIGDVHDYILVYAMNPDLFKEVRHLIPMNEEQARVYKNPNNDPNGRWRSVPITAQAGHATKEQFYPIVAPGGKVHYPPEGRCWGMSESTFNELREQGRIYFGKDGNSQPNVIRYLSEVDGVVPWTWWPHTEVGNTDEAKKEIISILGSSSFQTPKPVRLIKRILEIATEPNSIVLDAFAGSGSTAHAVMMLNQEDEGSRKWIMIENMDYAETITAERQKRAITGYDAKISSDEILYSEKLTFSKLQKGSNIFRDATEAYNNADLEKYSSVSKPRIIDNYVTVIGKIDESKQIKGLPGDFSFYELGEPLLTPEGFINESVPPGTIREYVWYMETRTPFIEPKSENPYYLGTANATDYYFCYERERTTTLDSEFLASLPESTNGIVVYADICTLPRHVMRERNVVFKKIPREIPVM